MKPTNPPSPLARSDQKGEGGARVARAGPMPTLKLIYQKTDLRLAPLGVARLVAGS
jgi:hypothetical protein